MAHAERIAVIVNPVSAGGRTGRRWPALHATMREVLDDFTVFTTQYRDHATVLTKQALRSGYTRIVSVGGDGTHHEILNGFFDGYLPINPAASLAIVPQGTGSDLARTLGIAKSRDAIEMIRHGRSMQIDIGRVTFTRWDGEPGVRYFINIADFGIGGAIVQRIEGSKRRLGTTLAYLWGLLRTLATFKPQHLTLQIGGALIEGDFLDVIVANGQYYGGGIRVARSARLDSGHFEVICVPQVPFWEALPNLLKLYDGSFVENPRWAKTFQASRIVAQSPEKVLIDLDGEGPGTLPLAIEILPAALKLVIGLVEGQEPGQSPAGSAGGDETLSVS